jgi:hypothetical protein
MRITYFVCWLAVSVGALFYGFDAARAQDVSADVRQACTPDAMRLCSAFVPDVAKITVCMKAKHRLLSQECRTAMAASHRGAYRRHVRVYREPHHHHGRRS